jgi:uncharacterized protein (TIGR02145 family)
MSPNFKAKTGHYLVAGTITVYANWQINDIDGNIYHEVKIGNQIWMVENLMTTKLNDGTPLKLVSVDSLWGSRYSSDYCWMYFDAGNKISYGALYRWPAVGTQKLAPDGWRVPDDDDWSQLLTYLGDASTAGGKLKATGTTYWNQPNTGATDLYGWKGVGGGIRYDNFFSDWKTVGYWWSSTNPGGPSPVAICAMLYNDNSTFTFPQGQFNYDGATVRCIRAW